MAPDDGIPTLDDVVRPGNDRGNGNQERQRESSGLSDEEIEKIAARVMERYSEALENTLVRAIKRALGRKEQGGTTKDSPGANLHASPEGARRRDAPSNEHE